MQLRAFHRMARRGILPRSRLKGKRMAYPYGTPPLGRKGWAAFFLILASIALIVAGFALAGFALWGVAWLVTK
jgi:hypothetical protein